MVSANLPRLGHSEGRLKTSVIPGAPGDPRIEDFLSCHAGLAAFGEPRHQLVLNGWGFDIHYKINDRPTSFGRPMIGCTISFLRLVYAVCLVKVLEVVLDRPLGQPILEDGRGRFENLGLGYRGLFMQISWARLVTRPISAVLV